MRLRRGDSSSVGAEWIRGYCVDVRWEGEGLRARGRNRAMRNALNPDRPDEDLVIDAVEIAAVSYVAATHLKEGVLAVTTRAGKVHEIPSLRQHNSGFDALAKTIAGLVRHARSGSDRLPSYEWCGRSPMGLGVPRPGVDLPRIPKLLSPLDPGIALPRVRSTAAGSAEAVIRVADPRIRVLSVYWHSGWQFAVPGAQLRVGAARRLGLAARRLPPAFGLAVWDAWRDQRLQRVLHDTVYATPGIPPGFVAEPSGDPERPSPHATGGVVDLTLTWNHEPLSLGTDFDAFIPVAHSRALESVGDDSPKVLERDLRRLLRHVMIKSGFVQLDCEWWHFEFGTPLWGAVKGRSPLYPAHARSEREIGE